jgi:methionyl-tRNA formyltransferase
MPFEAGSLAAVEATPSEVQIEQERLFVACGAQSWLEIAELQIEGKKRMAASEFLRGHALHSGDRLG